MKVFPKSDYDKKKTRDASYEYMSNRKPVVGKDFEAKMAFERKPYHMRKEQKNG